MVLQTKPSSNISENQQSNSDLFVDGDLTISNYVSDIEPPPAVKQEVREWIAKQKEVTRSQLALRLATILGGSILATYILMGLAAFSPVADKALIKDLNSQIVTPQVALFGVTLGYYFGKKDSD